MGHGEVNVNVVQEQFDFSKKQKTNLLIVILIGLILVVAGSMMLHKNSHKEAKHATNVEHTDVKTPIHAVSHQHDKEDHEHTHAAGDEHAAGAKHEADEHGTEHDKLHNAASNHGEGHVDNHAQENEHHTSGHHAKPWYTRIFVSMLTNSYYLLLISLLAIFYVSFNYIANAGWAVAFKRVPEAIGTFLPIAIILVLISLIDFKHIYHWAEYNASNLSKGDTGYDKILDGKKAFLNKNMLFGLVGGFGLVWTYYIFRLRNLSLKEDKADNPGKKFYSLSIRNSAVFTVIFGFTISVLSWILMMSLEPHWFSTIYSVYNFASGFVASLTVIGLFVVYLKSKGYLKLVTDDHYHDIAKFMFAFSIFWAYIWVSQYILIWYANLPEEVTYYLTRHTPKWNTLFFINLFLNFLVPIIALMSRPAKRNPKFIITVGILLLLGHYIDMNLLVYPGTLGEASKFGLVEIGMPLLLGGIFVYWVKYQLSKAGLVTVNHPYIIESALHDTGV